MVAVVAEMVATSMSSRDMHLARVKTLKDEGKRRSSVGVVDDTVVWTEDLRWDKWAAERMNGVPVGNI